MSTGLTSNSNVIKDRAANVVATDKTEVPTKNEDAQGATNQVQEKLSPKAITAVGDTAAVTKTKSLHTSAPLPGGADAAVDNLYFFEDEIYSIDKKGRVKFGLVVETSETYSGDEEDDFDDVLAKGEIRVAWHPDGREEIQLENAVGLADRTIIPADVIKRMLPGKDTQRGYCREINMCADVRIVGTDYVIKNVVAERLRLITNWQRDTAVCLDSWVGSTKGIEEIITLKSCSNGAKFEISSNEIYGFKDVNSRFRRGIFNNPIYYPNQILTGRLDSMDNITLLTPDIPLKTNKKGTPLAGRYIVESIRTKHVWVHWQCKALSEDNADIKASALQQPDPCVLGENLQRLKRFNLFESCMLQINDRNYLKLSECDVIIKKSEWDKEQALKFKLLQMQQQELRQELSQNMFVGNTASGSSNLGSNNTHHFDKSKKKLHIDSDKSVKPKKLDIKNFVIKNKEKSQEVDKQAKDGKNAPSKNDRTVSPSTEGWISEDDDDDGNDEDVDHSVGKTDQNFVNKANNTDSEDTQSTSTVSTCSSPTPRSSPKLKNRWRLNQKQITKTFKKVKSFRNSAPEKLPEIGEEIITEALLVYSTATVVWQDGTIESGIPSTSLYPIHHLDTHEFFPGDFVISGKEDLDMSYREYGVIQSVDHHGRIARVKWFTTYTSSEEPKPAYKGETEVSVYDLKDHPDFQYRPGIMVIRVANFVGEDATCTAGQIIDNYTDGRVKVWWVDGHISMCWPQDLFEVGQYDQTDLGGNESDDSWETESENSELGCNSPKLLIAESHILSNIERARVAIARLEEIFNISPNLQNQEVMRQLLVVYKGCRYLDRLLNTNFFHEDHFMGLIERVRKGGAQSISERAQDRKNRLFNEAQAANSPNSKQQSEHQQKQDQKHNCMCQAIVAFNVANKSNSNGPSRDYAPKVLFNLSSTPFKCSGSNSTLNIGNTNGSSTTALKRKASPTTARDNKTEKSSMDTEPTTLYNLLTTHSAPNTSTSDVNNVTVSLTPNSSPSRVENSPNKTNPYNAEKNQLLLSAMLNIEKVFEKSSQIKSTLIGASSQDDSGNCDGSSTSYASSSDLTNVDANSSLRSKTNDDQKSVSCSSIELTDDSKHEIVCVRLCSLLKDQLVKCINEIREKYYKDDNINLSEVFEYDIEEETTETIVEANELAIMEDQKVSDSDSLALADSLTTDNDYVEPPIISSNDVEYSACESITKVPSSDCFQVLSSSPKTHKFHLTIFHPNNAPQYYKAVQREHRLLKNSLPPGVWVRVFEDRMDLLSVMIEGPKKTPYEDGMFFFDIQLGREYPRSPPLCHYMSYCSDRLNPNLYEDGKVCVSLLGTWTGRDSEVWGSNSTLLQVIVSIQGLILVTEPYFNEAGYEKQKGTHQGTENSRMYNEMVIIKMVQATSKMLQIPPEIFRNEILEHFQLNGMKMYQRIKGWMELSKQMQILESENEERTSTVTYEVKEEYSWPEFPLVPASRGFCLTLAGLLDTFKSKLAAINTVKLNESLLENNSDKTE